jgi:hypothetical protein
MWITTHDGKLVNLEHVMDIERRAVQSLQAQVIARFADEQEVVLARGEFADTAYNAIKGALADRTPFLDLLRPLPQP